MPPPTKLPMNFDPSQPLRLDRQERFAQEYVRTLCGARAARAAGYPSKSASQKGCDMLRHPAIVGRVHWLFQQETAAAGVSDKRIVEELVRIAFADIRRLYDVRGVLLPPNQWPDDVALAVSSVRNVQHGLAIKLASKDVALNLLAKWRGMFAADNAQQQGNVIVEIRTRGSNEQSSDLDIEVGDNP